MAKNRRFWVFALAGDAEAEFLLTSSIAFPEPALEITEVAKTVLVDRADAVLGSLILQGRLRLRWVFAAPPKAPGAAQPILSSVVETPYAVRVCAPKATSEMGCMVDVAHVQDGRTEILQRDGRGCIVAIRDLSMLVLSVRYGKHEESALPELPAPAVLRTPQRPVISHFSTRRRSSQ